MSGPLPDGGVKALQRVVAAARDYIAEGCSCRSTHDEARASCRLNKAYARLVSAVNAYDILANFGEGPQ